MASARVDTTILSGLDAVKPASASSRPASTFCFLASPIPGSLATSGAVNPHTPAGLGSSAPPKVAAPWRGPTR